MREKKFKKRSGNDSMNNSHAEEPSSDTNHTELIQQILANPNSEMAKSLTQSKISSS